jgi:hypothetical protein
MKPYRGVVRGNTVILEETPEGAEGAEAIVLLKVSEEEDQVIVRRQKEMLQKGFPMGKLRCWIPMFWCARTTLRQRGGAGSPIRTNIHLLKGE